MLKDVRDGPALEISFDITARVMRFLDRNRPDLGPEDVITKPDGSPVTVMDLAGQALYVRLLEAACSGSGPPAVLCGEETIEVLQGPDRAGIRSRISRLLEAESIHLRGDRLLEVIDSGSHRPVPGTGSSHWICDPVDGTRRYISGHLYSTCLAYVHDGTLACGTIGVPDLCPDPLLPAVDASGSGTLVGAVRGGGACSVDPLDPSTMVPLPPLREVASGSVRVARSVGMDSIARSTVTLLEKAGLVGAPVEVDNQSKYAALVTGRVDLIAQSGVGVENRHVWDFAPGVMIAEESGARVGDGHDRPFNFDTGASLLENKGVRCARPDLYRACFGAD